MTEITDKDRNAALGAYLGWQVSKDRKRMVKHHPKTADGWESSSDVPLPDFSKDWYWLMLVFQSIVGTGVDIQVVNRAGGKFACNTVGYIAGAPKDTVHEAMFTTLSLHVMLLKDRDV